MALIQEGLQARADWAYGTEEVYFGIANANWVPESAAITDLIGSELLQTRLLASYTSNWNVVDEVLEITLQANLTSAINLTYNKLILWRGARAKAGLLSATIQSNGFTFAYTLPSGWPSLANGDRVVYNSTVYTLASVTSTTFVLTGLTGLTPGSTTIVCGLGTCMAAVTLANTQTIGPSVTQVLQIQGQSVTG